MRIVETPRARIIPGSSLVYRRLFCKMAGDINRGLVRAPTITPQIQNERIHSSRVKRLQSLRNNLRYLCWILSIVIKVDHMVNTKITDIPIHNSPLYIFEKFFHSRNWR